MDYLLEYATETEKKYIKAVLEQGSNRKAAKHLGVCENTIRGAISRAQVRAARQGVSPEHDMLHPAPAGFHVKGVSTYYNDEGKPTAQWVKTNIDHQQQERLMLESIQALKESVPKYKPYIKQPKLEKPDLLNLYTITDYHFGMLSWAEETGDDWDVDIAEKLLIEWFSAAIKTAPDSDTGIFCQLGDFLHFDSMDSITPTSGHLLDSDTRFQRLVRVVIRSLRMVIDMLLAKHKRVHIIMAEGNHDLASSVWLREWLHAFYCNEKRITVDLSPDPYYCYEFGNTSLFFHHGHKRKPSNVSDVFVAKYRDVFGRTKHSYAHMGHLHFTDIKENNLMIVEQHRTLAAKDAYASRGGWISGREAKVTTYHKNYGKVGELCITPDMVK